MRILINNKPTYVITSKFGEINTIHTTPHTGIDISMKKGTDLLSPVDGIITQISDTGSEGLGKSLSIRLADGKQLIMGHLSDIEVKKGEIVSAGQKIADSGNSGFSTGPHLHIGLKDEMGQFVDPSPLIKNIHAWAKPDGFMGHLDRFADKVIDKEVEWLLKPLGGAISRIFESLINHLNLYSVEIITVGIISCGLGMMVGPMTGVPGGKWLGWMFVIFFGGCIWRLSI